MTTDTILTPPWLQGSRAHHDRYKWVVLINTTIGILMVTINSSILLIALPDIFRGIQLDPLAPANTSYFLWTFMGFLLVTSVLVVSLGRVGDMYGRVRMYNLGFAVFTAFSILLSVTWMTGTPAALWIIIMRLGQGVGGALLFANSSAILTDAFPEHERGKAMGINGIALVTGSFIGLILGGVLAPIEWHLVFLVSVPFVEDADGFAQVFPEHKFHIVDVLQKHGHIVGMTGDGVNDAPALKKADCGIAVSGATDAARAAAAIVLTTPGLSVIIEAIKESRRIFQRMNSYAIYRIAETLRCSLVHDADILVFKCYPLTTIIPSCWPSSTMRHSPTRL